MVADGGMPALSPRRRGDHRVLGSGVPRAYRDHRRLEAIAYRQYVAALMERLGPLPVSAIPTLREAGLVNGELEEMALLSASRRRQDQRRLHRRRASLRFQLVALEKRLEELAKEQRRVQPPTSGTELAASMNGGLEEGAARPRRRHPRTPTTGAWFGLGRSRP
jgi:hypothetical protein